MANRNQKNVSFKTSEIWYKELKKLTIKNNKTIKTYLIDLVNKERLKNDVSLYETLLKYLKLKGSTDFIELDYDKIKEDIKKIGNLEIKNGFSPEMLDYVIREALIDKYITMELNEGVYKYKITTLGINRLEGDNIIIDYDIILTGK